MFVCAADLCCPSPRQINSDNDTLKAFARYTNMHSVRLAMRRRSALSSVNFTLVAFVVSLDVLFQALASYRVELMADAAAKGHPLVRHPFIHYPTDNFEKFPGTLWSSWSSLFVAL